MVSVKADPITPLPFETTSAIFVDTLEAVHVMLEELKGALEIAIDLEHHDEHSYFGIVCLMQISTRSKDWLVDTLKPWRHDLQILNEVFANSNILKVSNVAWDGKTELTISGVPRRYYGYHLASAGSRLVCRWTF